jgi:hypothetical protein
MPDQEQPECDRAPPVRRIVRYKAMVKVRMERDGFACVFSAARLSGASSASAWIRRVLREAATREIDRHHGRRQGLS